MSAYKDGDSVRFIVGPLGIVETPYSRKFLDATVGKDDVGTYAFPHEHLADWHWVRVEGGYVPIHVSAFERVSEEVAR